jgi:Arc/MetJ family transcription regulator
MDRVTSARWQSIRSTADIYYGVAKHLVDIDEEALGAARAELGTQTIRDTVNEALSRAAGKRSAEVKRSLDRLARLELDDRSDAWR